MVYGVHADHETLATLQRGGVANFISGHSAAEKLQHRDVALPSSPIHFQNPAVIGGTVGRAEKPIGHAILTSRRTACGQFPIEVSGEAVRSEHRRYTKHVI